MSSYADLAARIGDIQGRRTAENGRIWGETIANLGQLPLQIQQQSLLKAREQRLNQQAASEQQLTDLKLRGEQRQQAEQTALDQVWGADIWDDQGNMDPDKASAVAVANKAGHLVPVIREHAAKWAEQSARTREAQVKADEANAALDDRRRNSLGVAAIGVDPSDDGSFSALIGQAAKQKWLSPDEANRYLTAPPDARKSILGNFIRQSKDATERLKPREVPAGGTLVDPITNQPVFTAPEKPAHDEWSMFSASYAKQLGKPTWNDLNPGQQQNAFLAFARAKADPAAERQARTLQAQIDAENRRESFSEAQAGRKELTDKVETPYQTARASSNTLRDVVAAAQSGNKVAGSLQSLETTMAAIRAQGLNRINTAEIGVTANAGSLWDRLQGWFGKAEGGEPVPENIQKDMLQFADILDKAAYQKYRTGHNAITQRYGLKDEQPLPAPTASPSAAPDLAGLTPGHSRTFSAGPFAGQTWTLGAGGQPVKVK